MFDVCEYQINIREIYRTNVLNDRSPVVSFSFFSFFRSVTIEEAEEYCASQDDCCVFVEVSAKRNYHVDELFYQLFVVASLPLEMAPNHHRKVPLTFGSPTMLPPSQVTNNFFFLFFCFPQLQQNSK